VERYKALLAPFILRRLKSEVATQLMPKKHVVEVRVPAWGCCPSLHQSIQIIKGCGLSFHSDMGCKGDQAPMLTFLISPCFPPFCRRSR